MELTYTGHELVQQISVASEEQQLGANQINEAVQQLSQVTQQNAAGSEELATSAAELSSQAKQLTQTMSFFRISESDSNENTESKQTPKRLNQPAATSDKQSAGVKIQLDENDSLDSDYVKF